MPRGKVQIVLQTLLSQGKLVGLDDRWDRNRDPVRARVYCLTFCETDCPWVCLPLSPSGCGVAAVGHTSLYSRPSLRQIEFCGLSF
jgi:hypothetical protein